MRKLVVAAAVVACASAPVVARQGNDTAGIAKVRAAYEKAANAHDAAGLARLFTTDGSEMPPNAPAVKGRTAIEAFHKNLANEVTLSDLKVTPTDTKVSGDIGYDAGTYMQTVTPKGGKPMMEHGKYLVVLKKGSDGAWLVAYAMYSSDAPPPSPAR